MPDYGNQIGHYHAQLERARIKSVQQHCQHEIIPRFKANMVRSWNGLNVLSEHNPYAARTFLFENQFFVQSISLIESFLTMAPLDTETLATESRVLSAYNKLIQLEFRGLREYHGLTHDFSPY